MACMRSLGVVGVVSKISSRPALVAASLISPVSSRGMSGTSTPASPNTQVTLHQCCGDVDPDMQFGGPLGKADLSFVYLWAAYMHVHMDNCLDRWMAP